MVIFYFLEKKVKVCGLAFVFTHDCKGALVVDFEEVSRTAKIDRSEIVSVFVGEILETANFVEKCKAGAIVQGRNASGQNNLVLRWRQEQVAAKKIV